MRIMNIDSPARQALDAFDGAAVGTAADGVAEELADVTVVMVTYNSLACLQPRAGDLARLPRWVVVDNGSSDGTVAWLQANFPQCAVFANARNEGFGRANNRALQRVTTAHALLLNPDCRIDPPSILALLDCARRNPDAALIAPQYRAADGRRQQSYRPFIHRRSRIRGPYIEPVGDLCTDFVTGAALLVNLALMRPVGFFDPWYFLYCEDEDLCWSARQAGHAVIVAAGATAWHTANRSSPPHPRTLFLRHYCHTLSKLYLRRRLGFGRPAVAVYAAAMLLGSLLSLPLRLLSRRRLIREWARIAAVLTAPLQLSRRECQPGPGMLVTSLLSGSEADSKP